MDDDLASALALIGAKEVRREIEGPRRQAHIDRLAPSVIVTVLVQPREDLLHPRAVLCFGRCAPAGE